MKILLVFNKTFNSNKKSKKNKNNNSLKFSNLNKKFLKIRNLNQIFYLNREIQIEEHKEPVIKLWHSELGFLSMYVQNKVHFKNVDRKNACKYKYYCDPRDDHEA